MTISPFTLVHRRSVERSPAAEWTRELRRHNETLVDVFDKLDEPLRRSIIGTMRSFPSKEEGLRAVSVILHELNRQPKVRTVGFWDIGSSAGFFPQVIRKLNEAQDALTFFDIVASTPAGIISRPERVARWAEEALGEPPDETFVDNIIDEDFVSRAGPIRKEIGVEQLIGLVPSMIAGMQGDEVYWNHFSIAFRSRGLMLVSTYQLREFAAIAEKPFEVAVGVVALASLLVGISPRLGFHEDRGCLFDYNGSRVSLAETVRNPRIETSCMKLIPEQYRAAARAFVDVLSSFAPEQERQVELDVVSPLRYLSEDDSPPTRSAVRDEAREARDVQPISWAARESARFFVRLLAHEAFRKQPELAFIALAEREGTEVVGIAALFDIVIQRVGGLVAEGRIDEAQEIVGRLLDRRRRGFE